MSTVELDVDADTRVATIALNRPERLNGWTLELEHAYFDALEECRRRSDVRAIVVTGRGRGFCAGADLDELGALADDEAEPEPRDPRSPLYVLAVEKPVIAAVNGACAGMGVVQAALCDLRFGARGAKLTTAFVRRGLVAEHGLSWILPRLVGVGHAMDLLLSGRVVLAEEAAAIGFFQRLEEPADVLGAAQEYAAQLTAHCSPASLAAIKQQVYVDLARSVSEALEDADRLMHASLRMPDVAEGVRSFVAGRPPRFADLRPETSPAPSVALVARHKAS